MKNDIVNVVIVVANKQTYLNFKWELGTDSEQTLYHHIPCQSSVCTHFLKKQNGTVGHI